MTVGIPGWMLNGGFGVRVTYMEFIKNALMCRDLRILTPYSPIYKDLTLLLLPGGADVNPIRYGEVPSYYTGEADPIKEFFDVHVLPRYIERDIPVFGICRGLQTLAVHFGGKLVQDMDHETNPSDDPGKGVHSIIVKNNNKKVKVNSRHHQSVYVHSLRDTPIEILATHTSNQHHVEAIRVKGYKIAAVQYHPEDLDEGSGVEYALELIKSITTV